jgi:hypothetical protein
MRFVRYRIFNGGCFDLLILILVLHFDYLYHILVLQLSAAQLSNRTEPPSLSFGRLRHSFGDGARSKTAERQNRLRSISAVEDGGCFYRALLNSHHSHHCPVSLVRFNNLKY